MNYFVQILSVLMPAILFYLKYKYDIKQAKIKSEEEAVRKEIERDSKDERRLSAQTTLILEKIGDIEEKVTNMESILIPHILDSEFLIKFKDRLQTRANNIFQAERNLSDEHKKILNFWVEVIERFALRFCYSTKRKSNKKEVTEFLESQLRIKITEFESIIESSIPKPKLFKCKNIYFVDFLKSSIKDNFNNIRPLHTITELLILRMVENGLSPDSMIELFDNYINDFFKEYFKKLDAWELLLEIQHKDID